MNAGCAIWGMFARGARWHDVRAMVSFSGDRRTARGRRRSNGRPRHLSLVPSVDAHMRDALTEMYAYGLALEAERQRICKRMSEPDQCTQTELSELEGRSGEITVELELLHSTIAALRRHADPAGKYL